jgi:predicted O-methyltransferase YrrM
MSTLNPILLSMVAKRTNIFDTLLFLYSYTHERSSWKPGFTIAELGVNGGNSTVAFSVALAETARAGNLFSCDIVPCQGAAQLVAKAGAEHVWSFTQTDSLTFARQFQPASLDLVFIDSSHEYDQTVAELTTYAPLVAPGGRIFLHDTCSRPDTVGRAFKEFTSTHSSWQHYNIDIDCGLGSLSKPTS